MMIEIVDTFKPLWTVIAAHFFVVDLEMEQTIVLRLKYVVAERASELGMTEKGVYYYCL